MKDLNFRVWDSNNDCFFFGNLIYMGKSDYAKNGLYTIEQGTGIKDKNGVEIYEGDVCAGSFFFEVEVVFDKTHACFCYKYGSFTIPMDSTTDSMNITIVGHIHEEING